MLNPQEITQILKEAQCLHTEAEINVAVEQLANQINEKIQNTNPIILCVLKGALVAVGRLLPKLNFPLELDYIHASRYKKDKGYDLKFYAEPHQSLKNRTVLIVDDILDEGITLSCLINYCKKQGAQEVYTAVLVEKNRTRAKEGLKKSDFVGLYIPNRFIVGYGLDYEGYFRNMAGIYTLGISQTKIDD